MMKHFISIALATVVAFSAMAAKTAKPRVDRIDPPYWWTGMANDTLQLMVMGPDIRDAELSIDYPGVEIAEVARLDSPNYMWVYLVVGDEAQPGTVDLKFANGKKVTSVPYSLKARQGNDAIKPFDASDVLYLIMPDRFADGDQSNNSGQKELKEPYTVDRSDPNARHGGDIKGMLDHLDYIDSLGVTAVWVNPVLTNDMPNGAYHGYATTDYYNIDPRFGSNKEWEEFVKACHDRGIKVVMDMIFNHCGSSHPWFTDRPSKDWFNFPDGYVQTSYRLSTVYDPYASDYDKDRTVKGWFVESMPDLNQNNKHLMDYLIQNSIFWIEDSKIDGIRMDTHPYAYMEPMARWIKTVQKEYPGYNIVGECWYDNEGSEAFWQSGSKVNPGDSALPTVMDFWFAAGGNQYWSAETDPWGGLNKVYDHLALDYLFPDPQKILVFLDNHDTDRLLLEEPEDLGWWKQAMTFLLTSRGIPQIYYGTELLMNGTKKVSDGYIRLDMPGGFPGDTGNVFTREGRSDKQNEAYDFLSNVLKWRKGDANVVIAKGSLKHFMPQNGIYAYMRKLGDKEVMVLMNGNDSEVTTEMDRTLEVLPIGSQWTDLITGQQFTVPSEMTFGPRQTFILYNF